MARKLKTPNSDLQGPIVPPDALPTAESPPGDRQSSAPIPEAATPTLGELFAAAAEKERGEGLSCRVCGCRDLRVVYTRPGSGTITRRRQCRHCGRRMTTHERA